MRARSGLTSDGARAYIDVTRNVVVNLLIYFKTEFLHFSARICILIRLRVLCYTKVPMGRTLLSKFLIIGQQLVLVLNW